MKKLKAVLLVRYDHSLRASTGKYGYKIERR